MKNFMESQWSYEQLMAIGKANDELSLVEIPETYDFVSIAVKFKVYCHDSDDKDFIYVVEYYRGPVYKGKVRFIPFSVKRVRDMFY